MYNLLGCLFQMAGFAKVPALTRRLPGVFHNRHRLVARLAITKTNRGVYMGLLGKIRVAFFRNARLLLRGWLLHRSYAGSQRANQQNYEHFAKSV
jgi:hypothetical protein